MKQFYYLLLSLLFTTIIISSGCNNNTIPPVPPGTGISGSGSNGTLVCKINNVTFNATFSYATKVNNGIEINGFDSTGRALKINLVDQNPGVHNFVYQGANKGFVNSTADFNLYSSTANVYTLNNGNCEISYNETANTVSGTFGFNSLNLSDSVSYNVTNGKFLAIPIYNTTPITTNLMGEGSGKMHLDTVEWLAGHVSAMATNDTSLMITFLSGDSLRLVSFNLTKDLMPGTYPLFNNQHNQASYFDKHLPNDQGIDYQILNGGTITVTMHNYTTNEMKAYFNFTAHHAIHDTLPDVSVNNGIFNVKYQ